MISLNFLLIAVIFFFRAEVQGLQSLGTLFFHTEVRVLILQRMIIT